MQSSVLAGSPDSSAPSLMDDYILEAMADVFALVGTADVHCIAAAVLNVNPPFLALPPLGSLLICRITLS